MKSSLALLVLVLASCAAVPDARSFEALGSQPIDASYGSDPAFDAQATINKPMPPPPSARAVPQERGRLAQSPWQINQAAMQGYFGVAEYGNIKREGGSVTVEADDVEFPTIGGGTQVKMAGDSVDIGLEGLFAFGWRSDATAVAIGGGGAAVAVDVDMLLFELYGGPFINKFLGEKLRVYAGAGPVLQFATYDDSGPFSDDGSGFGYGYYVRAGAELRLGMGMMLGFGMRWSDTQIDIGSAGDLEIDGVQWLLTVTRGI